MAGEEIAWRRGLDVLAANLRNMSVVFQVDTIPLGPDALCTQPSLALTDKGEVWGRSPGVGEYIFRLLATLPQNSSHEVDEVLAGMAAANQSLTIAPPDLYSFGEEHGNEEEAFSRNLVVGEWHVMTRSFTDELTLMMDESPAAPDLCPDDDDGDEWPQAALDAGERYRANWEMGRGLWGRAVMSTALEHPDAVVRQHFGSIVVAGEGSVHPVMARFPELLAKVPHHMAMMMPPTLFWCAWPELTKWSRPSLALPSASRIVWGGGEWLREREESPIVFGHPAGEYAPAGYGLFLTSYLASVGKPAA
ncbi:MAG: hypothetical protein U0974_02155 [Gemmatimonadales bacterium]|nr:hypothetical protein [Gemmatimonadales bacterium]